MANGKIALRAGAKVGAIAARVVIAQRDIKHGKCFNTNPNKCQVGGRE